MTKKKLAESHTNVQIWGDTILLNKLYIATSFIDTSPKLMWTFDPQRVIRIGRARENQIQIQNRAISREHGQIFEYEGFIYVQNTSTRNVIEVKQKGMHAPNYLYAGQWIVLRDKDVITLGEHRIQVHVFRGRDIYK